jgi:hypothetical protein
MRLVLGHLHRHRRQLHELVPERRRVRGGGLRRQVVLTGRAGRGPVIHGRFGEAFRRQAAAQVGGVSRLAAGFTAGRLLAHGRQCLRRIGRRRQRRVGSVLTQARLQLTHQLT